MLDPPTSPRQIRRDALSSPLLREAILFMGVAHGGSPLRCGVARWRRRRFAAFARAPAFSPRLAPRRPTQPCGHPPRARGARWRGWSGYRVGHPSAGLYRETPRRLGAIPPDVKWDADGASRPAILEAANGGRFHGSAGTEAMAHAAVLAGRFRVLWRAQRSSRRHSRPPRPVSPTLFNVVGLFQPSPAERRARLVLGPLVQLRSAGRQPQPEDPR